MQGALAISPAIRYEEWIMNDSSRPAEPRGHGHLDSPQRRQLLPAAEILEGIGLRAGQTFLDVGAGAGYFALPATGMVGPDGRVIAVDVSARMIDELRRRALGLSLEARVCGEFDPGVAPASVDVALMAFVLHESADPLRLLRAVTAALAPDGRLAVLEWLPKPTGMGPPLAERLAPADGRKLLEDAGLRVFDEAEINAAHYRLLASYQ